jgi:hypothetical protein
MSDVSAMSWTMSFRIESRILCRKRIRRCKYTIKTAKAKAVHMGITGWRHTQSD